MGVPMAHLDRTEPYATFQGVPGVAFAQDGRLFDLAGHEVTYRREMVDDEGKQVERDIVERVQTMHVVIPDQPEPAAVPFFPRPVRPAVTERDDQRAANAGEMHWTYLKAQLAMYDEPYTTKEAALAFLAGKGQAAE
jgi:hypothetical protein